ncbi:MAG: TonB-dependent receptor [Bacteroidia bacterium]|nr:TonB-dependent receptor [Bacteroidia bacterium]
MKKLYLSLLFLSLAQVFNAILAQDTLRGRVFDQANNEALTGVSLQDSRGNLGTVSDEKGYFALPFTPEIRVSRLGYQSQTLHVEKGTRFLNVSLVGTPLALSEIVVSAYQSQRSLRETPGSVSIITEQALHRDNDVNLAPVLNRVPGVYMHTGSLNTNRITIRGIGARTPFGTSKIRAYFNEIPLTTGENETTLEDIDLKLIDRIEVIKGPASSLYGASLGGTINLKAERADYQTTSLENETILGSYGLFRNVSSFRRGNDQSNIHLLYSHTDSEGYRENNEYDRESLAAVTQFYPGENSTVTFLGNFIHLRSFIPSSIDSLTFRQNPQAAARNWALTRGYEDYNKLIMGLSYQNYLSDHWELNSSVFANFRRADEPDPSTSCAKPTKPMAYGGISAIAHNWGVYPPDLPWEENILMSGTPGLPTKIMTNNGALS